MKLTRRKSFRRISKGGQEEEKEKDPRNDYIEMANAYFSSPTYIINMLHKYLLPMFKHNFKHINLRDTYMNLVQTYNDNMYNAILTLDENKDENRDETDEMEKRIESDVYAETINSFNPNFYDKDLIREEIVHRMCLISRKIDILNNFDNFINYITYEDNIEKEDHDLYKEYYMCFVKESVKPKKKKRGLFSRLFRRNKSTKGGKRTKKHKKHRKKTRKHRKKN